MLIQQLGSFKASARKERCVERNTGTDFEVPDEEG
jgi:hypothetical protein